MTIKQIEPLLLQGRYHTEIWVFSPNDELVLDVIDLDPQFTYHPTNDRNWLKLKHLKSLPHKVTGLGAHADTNEDLAKLQIVVKLGKGYWWNV